MTGVITALCGEPRPTYGFVRGEDGVSRFFLPSGMHGEQAIAFDALRPGMRVEFAHEDHPKGPRAIDVQVIAAPMPLEED